MGSRRPPDILRKSHAHTDGKPRDRNKRVLDDALDESLSGEPEEAVSDKKDGRVSSSKSSDGKRKA